MKKLKYYLSNGILAYLPSFLFRYSAKKLLARAPSYDEEYLRERVNYYNKHTTSFELTPPDLTKVKDFKKTGGTTAVTVGPTAFFQKIFIPSFPPAK